MIVIETNVDYLIPALRLHLGDLIPTQYRYLDEWLRTSLVMAVIALARWWDSKYLVDETLYTLTAYSGVYASGIYRNEVFTYFENLEPPIIQEKDEWPIVLMASIILKSGQLENVSWDTGSWRDAELSHSNIESAKQKGSSLERDIAELEKYLKPPVKRLSAAQRNSFPTQV